MTRLLISSHTEHYLVEGHFVGWGATVREIDQLASIFDEVVHIGTLYKSAAPRSALPYHAANIRFVGVPPGGGEGLKAI